MQTIGRTLGKGTEKVRTWYNNRRALDRKLGIDVSRNPADSPPAPPFALFPAADPSEEPVVLPGYAIASPGTPSACNHAGKGEKDVPSPNNTVKGLFESTIFVNVTPSAIAWAPSASPVTGRPCAGAAPASLQPQPNRFRITPLRIRNSRVVMGSSEICGEIGDNPSADRGLEVKFLFGKKRIVYEWYCGEDFVQAKKTGGPYAKMEMNFSSVANIQLFRGGAVSALQLSFSEVPTTYLQTQESMDKFKVRAQQRQYRKVTADEFPIRVCVEQHRISMRTDDAIRVARVLIEENPHLAASSKAWEKDCSLAVRVANPSTEVTAFKIEKGSGNPTVDPVLVNTPQLEHVNISRLNICKRTPGEAMASPGVVGQLSQPFEQCNTPMVRSAEMVSASPSTQNDGKREGELPIVRPITATGAASNLLGSPAPWPSPATPFIPSGRPRGRDIMQWSTGVVPLCASTTPFRERTNIPSAPRDTTKVRRELNFNALHHMPTEPRTPASKGRKRKAEEAKLDDKDLHQRVNDTPRSAPKLIRRISSCESPNAATAGDTPARSGEQLDAIDHVHGGTGNQETGEHADSKLRALPR